MDGGASRHLVRLAALLLLLVTLGVSTAFGMLLLLPLYVQELGGNEANFGVILSSATVTAVLCIGLLIRYPEALRPHAVVALLGGERTASVVSTARSANTTGRESFISAHCWLLNGH